MSIHMAHYNGNQIQNRNPLHWPQGWEATDSDERRISTFKTPLNTACKQLERELTMLGAEDIVLTSNMPVNRFGHFASQHHKKIDNPGVALYFTLNGNEQCIPCDRWLSIDDNIHAINKTIHAMRGLERWGAHGVTRAALQGFQALPAPKANQDSSAESQITDFFAGCDSELDVRTRYRDLAKAFHPDTGGNASLFADLTKQYHEAVRTMGSR